MDFDPTSGAIAALLAMVVCAAVGTALQRRHRRDQRALSKRLRAAHSRLDEQTQCDALTGLATRSTFEHALETALQQAESTRAALALFYVSLDSLRTINDLYGHETGDAVLVQAAQRLRRLAPPHEGPARIGGSEFVFCGAGEPAARRATAQAIAAAFDTPFAVAGRALTLSASVGVAAYPDHGARARLLSMAATAMRSVKLAGGAAHAEFEPRMAVDLHEQAELARDLKLALERGELSLVYQPKIDARSLQVTAAEALLRWKHPERGVVGPAVFIPVAERHGLIGAIGRWVLEEAVQQAARWREKGLRMRVAINVSGYQMRQDDFVRQLEKTLERHRIAPGRFTCEITESVAMEDTSATLAAFERLRRLGVHVSIDDFGTGHSSLASLRRLPAAELKVDRAFVNDLGSSGEARSIVRAIVQMAHSLDLRVVAEGVETEAQRDALIELGCDELQGFLFARPMSPTALALWAMDADAPAAIGFRPSLFKATQPFE